MIFAMERAQKMGGRESAEPFEMLFACIICLHASAGICLFLIFSVFPIRVMRRWWSANLSPEMHRILYQLYSENDQISSPIDQNGGQGHSGVVLEASRLQVTKKNAKSS